MPTKGVNRPLHPPVFKPGFVQQLLKTPNDPTGAARRFLGPRKGVSRPLTPPATAAAGTGVPAGTPAAPLDLPVDPAYDAQIAALQRTKANTIAGLAAARTQGYANYGYTGTEQTDPVTGLISVTGLTFNPNDPFSKASLLKKTYDASRARSAESSAASGGLYSGAAQHAQDYGVRQQMQAEDALQKSLISFLGRNAQQQVQAGVDYETGAGQAYGDRVTRASTMTTDANGNLVSGNPNYVPSTATTPAAPAAPRPSKWITNTGSGARAGQQYRVKQTAQGTVHVYRSGKRILIPKK